MSKGRKKVSAAYNHFISELNRFKKFDSENQANFAIKALSKKQLYQLTESIFFTLFREYENFIRDIFLLYAQEKNTMSGLKVNSHLRPNDFFHAERLIQSSMSFLDWNSPEVIIERAELYLKNGFPIKLPYTTNRAKLVEYKKLRNHIAHNSTHSMSAYLKVLNTYFGVIPLKVPSVGEYLQLTSKSNPANYHLLDFFDLLQDLSTNLVA